VSVEIANNALSFVAFELRCSRIRLPRKKTCFLKLPISGSRKSGESPVEVAI
jgi:hypothetical protein